MKNLTTCAIPDRPRFAEFYSRANYKNKKRPCFACRFGHCHQVEFKAGPHKGEIIEEPEYEALAAVSSMIDNTDPDAAIWLASIADRMGVDAKELGWVLGLAFECYEKGLITKKDTGGIELTWGNVQAAETLLHMIATRNGFGDVLAEGVMRAAEKIGGDAPKFAVYTHKGNGPHVFDGRAVWHLMFMQSISDMGSHMIASGDVGELMPDKGMFYMDPSQAFAADEIPKDQAITCRRGGFMDSLGVCNMCQPGKLETVTDTVGAVTGWDFTWREGADAGERVANLMRAFNIRHGHTREHDTVSPRLLEPLQDGIGKGVSVAPKYDKMVDDYYEAMGWDKAGRPLPKTLKRLGLDSVAKEL